MDRRRALAQYLQGHHVMTVATVGQGGPWAAAVFYANDDLDFYFVSAPGTRHALDLARHPQVAAAIQEDCHSWSSIKGVQMSATVVQVEGDQLEHARQLYGLKFPGILDGTTVPAGISAALQAACWYRLRAASVRFVDNSVGFGHRDEWQLAGERS